ncbi:MAG: spore maturation protein [Ignavibacteriae bacterium]|nr:spore maturation protein [Ignavibacteriota bacterium]
MLNYVWLALLMLGIGVALTTDIIDKSENKYQNNVKLSAEIILEDSTQNFQTGKNSVIIKIPKERFNSFYKTQSLTDIEQKAFVTFSEVKKSSILFLIVDEKTPVFWKNMAKISGKEDDLTGEVFIGKKINGSKYSADLILENISFSKMKDVTNSALDYAGTAVDIALGLIGIMTLWLGVMKVAEEAGLIKIIANVMKPLTKFLYPSVPQDHPAMGAMIMNMAANMLGLGNAATPFGLKAMEELDKLNPNKGVATDAMCTFLAVNTAGLTLIPATAIAVRAASGSSDPAIIIGTSVFGASCATIAGITSAKILEKFPLKEGGISGLIKSSRKGLTIFSAAILIIFALAISGLATSLMSYLSFLNPELFKSIIQIISILAIPMLIFIFVGYGAIKKVKIYEMFIEGAKEGFNVAIRIIPYLVAMLVAIGIFRAGGAMEMLIYILTPFTNLIGMPAEALPMALMRPLSGSGSLGVMAEIIATHGPDSMIGILVSTFFGSSETTFYVIAVYFGAVNIRKIRHALAAGLIADIAGVLGAIFIVKLLFG